MLVNSSTVEIEARRYAGAPGNRLEKLSCDRRGQYCIRVNDQWRVCFRWDGDDAYDVEIVDYHSSEVALA